MPKDLGSFLTRIRREFPRELLDVKKPIRPHMWEVSALLKHLEDQGRFPITVFHNPKNLLDKDSAFPLVMNLFASRERCALALGLPPERSRLEMSLEFARREQRRVDPKVMSEDRAPVKEVIEKGARIDLRKFPIPRLHHMDLGCYTTMPCIMRDPDEGFYDVTFVKCMYKQPRRMVASIELPHLRRIFEKYEERKQPAPFVTILGHHPAFLLGSLALTEFGNDDYETIGSYLGEPVRLTPSETWGKDFLVPADAEIVIEGLLPPGVREICNPFGEVTGHYQPQWLMPVLDVKAVTYRENALFQGIFSGHLGHWILGTIPKEGSLFNALKKIYPHVTAVHLPVSGCGRFACYISVKKRREGVAKTLGMAALLNSPLLQWAVIVDDDIDVFKEREVVYALITCVNPARDVDVVENVFNLFTTALGHRKVIIDATRPLDVPFPERIKVPEAALARVKLEDFLT
ncbi:MAG: UbiD family decarboxylase [Deltaproteobacteria bacterium]|nr:UbiD family decarboxylase [Deltaproteobacteria bacterium]